MKKHLTKITFAIILASTMVFASCEKKDSVIKIGINQFAEHVSLDNCRVGFIEGLASEGFVDGENIEIQTQNAMKDFSKSNTISASFVAKNYDLVVGIATPSAQSLYNAVMDKSIPMIFVAVSDPIDAGLVESFENPGTITTGVCDVMNIGGQLEMIKQLLPNATKIGVIYSNSESNAVSQLNLLKESAPAFGFEVIAQGINAESDIPLTTDSLISKVDCFMNLNDNTIVSNLPLIISKTNAANIPVFGSEEEQLKLGCVGSVGLDYIKVGKEAGKQAAKILKGEKVENIPVVTNVETKPFINESALQLLAIEKSTFFDNAEIINTDK